MVVTWALMGLLAAAGAAPAPQAVSFPTADGGRGASRAQQIFDTDQGTRLMDEILRFLLGDDPAASSRMSPRAVDCVSGTAKGLLEAHPALQFLSHIAGPTRPARHAIYREIEQLIARDAIIVPLFHEQIYRFVRPEISGVTLSYWAPSVNYADLSVR